MKTFILSLLLSMTFIPLFAQQQAPSFSLNDLDGNVHQLSEYQGKVVFLFFFGHACPSCRATAPSINQQIYDRFKDNEHFVALGLDQWNGSSSQVNSFKSITNTAFPLLLNAGSYVSNNFNSTYDRLNVIDKDGNIRFKGSQPASNQIQATITAIEEALEEVATSIEDENQLSNRLQLEQNYPNPFNPTTTISFSLDQSGPVELTIYNILGVKVKSLIKSNLHAGNHSVVADLSDSQSGVYFYQLKTSTATFTKKMTLLK